MLSTEPKIYRGDREIPPSTFVAPARQAPAGIVHNHSESKYPRFIPWREITCIGVYEEEGAPFYLVGVQRASYDGTIDLFRTQDLKEAEKIFVHIVYQIEAGATIIGVP